MTGPDELEARLARMEARLARAEGHAAILDLKSRYGSLADARYSRRGPKSASEIDALAEQLADLFTADAVWEGGGALGRCEGRAEIYARFREPTLHYAWHFFVKPEIHFDALGAAAGADGNGARARASWDVLAMITTVEGRAMWMVGVEQDEYECVEGRWLHRRMKLDSQLMAPYDRGWAPVPRPATNR